MGSYAQCWLGNFVVGSSKNDIDPSLIHLFRSTDKKVVSDPNSKVPEQVESWVEDLKEDGDAIIVYYSANSTIVKDRLELSGYTIGSCRDAFSEGRKYEVENTERMCSSSHGEIFNRRLEILKSMDVDSWMSALSEIRQSNMKPHRGASQETLVGYMLSEDWYGYPGVDTNVVLRLALEVYPEADELVYDVTDLVRSGYFEPDEDFVNYGFEGAADDFFSKAKIIVLTEGRTDSWVLSEAISVLYPHLSDYYSFMDFDGFRSAGGVGSLVNLVKSFAGAGIVNRTIALFDNDTAAASAMRGLSSLSIPRNIVVLQLPDLESLEHYPTIGPTGIAVTNVNGVASSIELMFGADVLADAENGFVPVQWTGYEQSVRKYQGEVMHKLMLHEKFREKISASRKCDSYLAAADWAPMRLLFGRIFSAFHSLDRESIIALSRIYV